MVIKKCIFINVALIENDVQVLGAFEKWLSRFISE